MSVSKPLPERMRPDDLALFLGQTHLGSRLRSLMQAKRLPSLLFFGPPGCGKSTLALLLAKGTGKTFLRLSAPEAGLQHLRRSLSGIEILVLDELHRFSKAQQDFFLPLVESGDLTLLATTTENPSFSVTRQLLSRLHVLRLRPLGRTELVELARRGAMDLQVEMPDELAELLAGVAHGDARTLLNLVEYVAALPSDLREIEHIKAALPEVLVRHDKDGDNHYELASALIKSIRGSDVDAALYYLACLLEGGEDPRFICRRLILSASEDVGLADPNALQLAVACQQAVEFVGMPEGFIPLAETVTYLALARKSNATYAAYLNAQREIKLNGSHPVPLHLRNPSTQMHKEWGYGKEYKYPHNYPDSWIQQTYLPQELEGRRFYQPRDNGEEPRLTQWWRRLHKIKKTEE
ncbi:MULTISPECIES: replication-associated recombination protein A [Desulfovibrio]|uniref:Replication-associated recombination protein A n=2 Tax=Desulfovibrio desulfuricans TaxID=876 RepID=A0AA94HV19_DESDE|nr:MULTISPECIES: replication-associated recombination protein A [Desulfovibrio]ATD81337.1 replication-associated recombination protein A [Desulfovibrio sp. G11]MDY0203654.1 replication-associated recombination protein A [Desulfovibrio desulfuricans]SFW71580.1 putative ATPase [Desulfovibrio desulfuricans]SPD36981.1 DNA polymerase III, clamp loader complex, gamma/delta/delta subunit [Desulfovibrio sp. G11]